MKDVLVCKLTLYSMPSRMHRLVGSLYSESWPILPGECLHKYIINTDQRQEHRGGKDRYPCLASECRQVSSRSHPRWVRGAHVIRRGHGDEPLSAASGRGRGVAPRLSPGGAHMAGIRRKWARAGRGEEHNSPFFMTALHGSHHWWRGWRGGADNSVCVSVSASSPTSQGADELTRVTLRWWGADDKYLPGKSWQRHVVCARGGVTLLHSKSDGNSLFDAVSLGLSG